MRRSESKPNQSGKKIENGEDQSALPAVEQGAREKEQAKERTSEREREIKTQRVRSLFHLVAT